MADTQAMAAAEREEDLSRGKIERDRDKTDQRDAEALTHENPLEAMATREQDKTPLADFDQTALKKSVERGKKAVENPDTENIRNPDLDILPKIEGEGSEEFLESPEFEEKIDTTIFYLTRYIQNDIPFQIQNGHLETAEQANEYITQFSSGNIPKNLPAFEKGAAEIIHALRNNPHPNAQFCANWWQMEVSDFVTEERAQYLQNQKREEEIPEDPVVKTAVEKSEEAVEKMKESSGETGIFSKLKSGISSLWSLEFLPEEHRGGITGFAARSLMVWAAWEVISTAVSRVTKIVSGEEKLDKKNGSMLKWILGALGLGAVGKVGWDAVMENGFPEWMKIFIPDEVLEMMEKARETKEKADEYAKVLSDKKEELLQKYPWMADMVDDILPDSSTLKALGVGASAALGVYFVKMGGIGFILKTILKSPVFLAKGGFGILKGLATNPIVLLAGVILTIGFLPKNASAEGVQERVEDFFKNGEGKSYWDDLVTNFPNWLEKGKSAFGGNNTEVQDAEKMKVHEALTQIADEAFNMDVSQEKQDDKQKLLKEISEQQVALSTPGPQEVNFRGIASYAMQIGMSVSEIETREEGGDEKYKYKIGKTVIPVWVNHKLDERNVPDYIENMLAGIKDECQEKFKTAQGYWSTLLGADFTDISWEDIKADIGSKYEYAKLKIEDIPQTKEFWIATASIAAATLLIAKLRSIDKISGVLKLALKVGGIVMVWQLLKNGIKDSKISLFQKAIGATQDFIGSTFDVVLPPEQRKKIATTYGEGYEELMQFLGFGMADDSNLLEKSEKESFEKTLNSVHLKVKQKSAYAKYNSNLHKNNETTMDELYSEIVDGFTEANEAGEYTLRAYSLERYIAHADALEVDISITNDDSGKYILTLAGEEFVGLEFNPYGVISTEKDESLRRDGVMKEQCSELLEAMERLEALERFDASEGTPFLAVKNILSDLETLEEEDFMDFYALKENEIIEGLNGISGVRVTLEDHQYTIGFQKNNEEGYEEYVLMSSGVPLDYFSKNIVDLSSDGRRQYFMKYAERLGRNRFFIGLADHITANAPKNSVVHAKAKRLLHEIKEERPGEGWDLLQEALRSEEISILSISEAGEILFRAAGGGEFSLTAPSTILGNFIAVSVASGILGMTIGMIGGGIGLPFTRKFSLWRGARLPSRVLWKTTKFAWKTTKFAWRHKATPNTMLHRVSNPIKGGRMVAANIWSHTPRHVPIYGKYMANYKIYLQDYLVARRKIDYFSVSSGDRAIMGMGDKVNKWQEDLSSAEEKLRRTIQEVYNNDPSRIPPEWKKKKNGKLKKIDKIIEMIESQDKSLQRIRYRTSDQILRAQEKSRIRSERAARQSTMSRTGKTIDKTKNAVSDAGDTIKSGRKVVRNVSDKASDIVLGPQGSRSILNTVVRVASGAGAGFYIGAGGKDLWDAFHESDENRANTLYAKGSVNLMGGTSEIVMLRHLKGAGLTAGGIITGVATHYVTESLDAIEETTRTVDYYNRETKDGELLYTQADLIHLVSTTNDVSFRDFLKTRIIAGMSDFTTEDMERISLRDKNDIRRTIWQALCFRSLGEVILSGAQVDEKNWISWQMKYIELHSNNFSTESPFKAVEMIENSAIYALTLSQKQSDGISPLPSSKQEMDEIASGYRKAKAEYEEQNPKSEPDSVLSAGLYEVAVLYGYQGDPVLDQLKQFFNEREKENYGIYWNQKENNWYVNDSFGFDEKIEGYTPEEIYKNISSQLLIMEEKMHESREDSIMDHVASGARLNTSSWGQQIHRAFSDAGNEYENKKKDEAKKYEITEVAQTQRVKEYYSYIQNRIRDEKWQAGSKAPFSFNIREGHELLFLTASGERKEVFPQGSDLSKKWKRIHPGEKAKKVKVFNDIWSVYGVQELPDREEVKKLRTEEQQEKMINDIRNITGIYFEAKQYFVSGKKKDGTAVLILRDQEGESIREYEYTNIPLEEINKKVWELRIKEALDTALEKTKNFLGDTESNPFGISHGHLTFRKSTLIPYRIIDSNQHPEWEKLSESEKKAFLEEAFEKWKPIGQKNNEVIQNSEESAITPHSLSSETAANDDQYETEIAQEEFERKIFQQIYTDFAMYEGEISSIKIKKGKIIVFGRDIHNPLKKYEYPYEQNDVFEKKLNIQFRSLRIHDAFQEIQQAGWFIRDSSLEEPFHITFTSGAIEFSSSRWSFDATVMDDSKNNRFRKLGGSEKFLLVKKLNAEWRRQHSDAQIEQQNTGA